MASTTAKVQALRDMLSSMKESAQPSGGTTANTGTTSGYSGNSGSGSAPLPQSAYNSDGSVNFNVLNQLNGLQQAKPFEQKTDITGIHHTARDNFNSLGTNLGTAIGYGSHLTNQMDMGSLVNGSEEWHKAMGELDSINNKYNPNSVGTTPSGAKYSVDMAKDFANTEEGQALKEAFIRAKLNGDNPEEINKINQSYGVSMDEYIEKLNKKKAGLDGFLEGYLKYMKEAIEQGKMSEQLLANNKMQQDLLAQQDAQRQADKDYTDKIDIVNQGTYDAYENAKVRGMQRGINYSAQQTGVEAGIASRGLTDKRKAQETRDIRLDSVRDKINAIKSGNMNELQSIEAKYNGKLQEAIANAYMKSKDREWQVSDNYLKHDWDKEDVMLKNQLTQQNMEKQQDLDLQKMSVNHGYDLEKLDIQNKYDQDKINKMFENDLKKMEVDHGYKKELQNMDYSFKKEFLKLETVEKKELMKFDTEQKKVILALEQKYKKEILNSQPKVVYGGGRGYSSGGKYYSSGKSSKQAYSDVMDRAGKEMAMSLVMNDPHVKVNRADVATDLVQYASGKMSTDQFMGKYTKGSYDVPSMKQWLNKTFPNRLK